MVGGFDLQPVRRGRRGEKPARLPYDPAPQCPIQTIHPSRRQQTPHRARRDKHRWVRMRRRQGWVPEAGAGSEPSDLRYMDEQ